jgi:hypothetical protein
MKAEALVRKQIISILIGMLLMFNLCLAVDKTIDKYGRLMEFEMIDNLGEQRDIQIFIPHNIDYKVPVKVVWYFRGTNGIYLTWDIETTKLYKLGYDEKAVIVAPGLYRKLWSKGSDETDYYLIKDIIETLKTLKDSMNRPVKLDLENMAAIGFSAGGGFIYHLAGRFPLIFNEILFRKYIDHARSLDVTVHDDGSITGGDEYDVQAVRDLIAAYEVFPDEKPPFLVSVGDVDDVGGIFHIEMMKMTRDILEKIGFEASFYLVPDLHHRFYVDYTPEFYEKVRNFLFPVRLTIPYENFEWRYKSGKEFEIKWTSALSREKLINIDLFTGAENKYFEIARGIPDSGSYAAVLDNLTLKTGECFIRLTTDDHMDIAYSSSFKIIADSLNLILQATRKEERAWLIKRYYGEINLSVEHIVTGGPCVSFMIYRKELEGEYRLIKEIPVEELQNNKYFFQDKYLIRSETYIYKAEALDRNGVVLAVSRETDLPPNPKASVSILQADPRRFK